MLRQYDEWIEEYNINGLLHDRLITKGGKGKSSRRGRTSNVRVIADPSSIVGEASHREGRH